MQPNIESEYASPPFQSEEDSQLYVQTISPPRDLICPITQELFMTPMLALGDGHTYEQHAIQTWFHTQLSRNGISSDNTLTPSSVSIRSPVSNAFMEGDNKTGLVHNKSVSAMARHFREKLGFELCKRCEYVWLQNNAFDEEEGLVRGLSNANKYNFDKALGDGGFRIRTLVEAGADLTMKGKDGMTALMMLIESSNLELVNFFLLHGAPVNITNDDGKTSLQIMKDMITNHPSSFAKYQNLKQWHTTLQKISKQERIESERDKVRQNARNRANQVHRESQRLLEAHANRNNHRHDAVMMPGDMRRDVIGLGNLEESGWGYFPSLVALQYQDSIPPPSLTFMDIEIKERLRLGIILKVVASLIFFFFIFS